MQLGVLTTDYGPHPPEKWARMTAWQITNHLVEVDERSASRQAIEIREARDLMEREMYAGLKALFTTVQNGERSQCQTIGYPRIRLSNGVDWREMERDAAVAEHVDPTEVIKVVIAAADAHPTLKDHFSKEEVQKAVLDIWHKDAASVMNIEHDHLAQGLKVGEDGRAVRNADHDPKHPQVVAYLALKHNAA
jgi:hypothetical protein